MQNASEKTAKTTTTTFTVHLKVQIENEKIKYIPRKYLVCSWLWVASSKCSFIKQNSIHSKSTTEKKYFIHYTIKKTKKIFERKKRNRTKYQKKT